MRLKLLFFPIVLVVCVAIFIGYIWPEINNLKIANEEKMATEQSLKEAKEKQAVVEQLGAQIASSTAEKSLVYSYLPDKKVEEQIIAAINYLAADSQVSLATVSLTDVFEKISASGSDPYSESGSSAAMAENNGNSKSNQNQANNNKVQFSEASITIIGDYEKIRFFLDQIQKMTLFNKIKSVKIYTKKENSSGNAGAGANNNASTDSGNVPPNNNIFADVVIDFGYLKSSKDDKAVKLKSDLDNETINVLKQYVSQKTATLLPIGGDSGNKGKINPFIP